VIRLAPEEFKQKSEDDIFFSPWGQRVEKDYKDIVINGGKKYVNR